MEDINNTIINEILCDFEQTKNFKETAQRVGCGWQRVVKVLSTYGVVINDSHAKIMDLYRQGKNAEDIAKEVGRSVKTVQAYLPAQRPFYGVNLSENAVAIKKSRVKNPAKIPVGRAEDLTGQIYGDLKVLYRVDGNITSWYCKCLNCGKKKIVTAGNLKNGTGTMCHVAKSKRKRIDYGKYAQADLSILSESERKILLKRIECPDATIKEIAFECGISYKSAGPFLCQARSKLEETYKRKKAKRQRKKDNAKRKQNSRTDYKQYEYADLSILSEGERKVLLKRLEHPDATIKEIALECETSYRSAGALLSRAKQKLDGTYDWEKVNENRRIYVKTHWDKIKKSHKAYNDSHKEELKEQRRKYFVKYYNQHKEEYQKRSAEHYQKNREKILAKAKERRAKQKEDSS